MDLPIDELNNIDNSALNSNTHHKSQGKKRVKKNIPTSPSAILEKTFYNSLQGIKRGKKKIQNDKFTINNEDYEDVVKYNYMLDN